MIYFVISKNLKKNFLKYTIFPTRRQGEKSAYFQENGVWFSTPTSVGLKAPVTSSRGICRPPVYCRAAALMST